MFSKKRHVGLSKHRSVPRLLSRIDKAPVTDKMKEVDVDAPPLSSSSDLSDNDGLSNRGNIRPTPFLSSGRRKPSPAREIKNDETDRNSMASAGRFKRTRGSTRPPPSQQPGSSPKEATDRQPEAIDTDNGMSSPASKKPKRSLPGEAEQSNHFVQDIFAPRPVASRRYGKNSRAFGNKARREASPAGAPKRPPKEATPEADKSPRRYKLNIPDLPPTPVKGPASPARKFKTIPGSDLDSPAKSSPMRKKRWKMPDDDSLAPSAERETPEESQRPVFRIPDALPDLFIADDGDRQDFATSPIADRSETPNFLRESNSPLTDLDSSEPTTPVCPLCGKEVDRTHLDEYKKTNPRGRVANMRRFCEAHRRRSARETWVQRGYPDIDWPRFDERIARHYPFVRGILKEDGASSHYGSLFAEMVRSGRNKSLLNSDVNLTPGYYGFRGLRAMTENIVTEFGPLLLKRSQEDRLVAARGTMMYLQSVVVPELAVRLIMEDMSVGEEEARQILTESTEVGELLNDEIPDVVISSDDEDEEDESDR